MSSFDNSNLHINEKTVRELEDIVIGFENNVIRISAEDEALLLQAYNSDAGVMLCEKYRELVSNIDAINGELKTHIDTIKNEKKRIL